jgi:septum site-determining protein MinC
MTQNSTKNSVVQVSGRGTNVEFIIDDVSPFDQIIKGLRDYLVENRGMWSGGAIAVNVGNRLTSRDQLNEIKKIIEYGSGLTVIRFSCSPETMATPPSDPGPVRPLQHNEVIIPARKPTVAPPPPVRPAAAPAAPPVVEASRIVQPPKTYPHHNEVIIPEGKPTVVPPLPVDPVATPAASNEATRQTGMPIKEAAQVVSPTQTHRQDNAATPEPIRVQHEPSDVVEAEQPLLMDEELGNSPRPSYLQSQRDTALLVKSTCRSGKIIRHQGDVVVLGDVNPGAEVVASGDIAVFGCLRGFAHAGSEGDTKATIVALSLGSPRLQIGPHVGISSGNKVEPKYTDSGPVIAYARRRSIHVALFKGRFFKYGKGELYDG